MNTNILKATLLFVGVIVNSLPTPEPDIPETFIADMVESKFYKFEETSDTSKYYNKHIQVALAAWKQGVIMPKDNYILNIVGTDTREDAINIILEVAEINYDGTDHKDWVRVQDLKWVNIPVDYISKFELILEPDYNKNIKIGFSPSAYNWTFNLFFKTKESSLEGIRENEDNIVNPTVEFCSEDVTTVGPNKTLGAICQFDPMLHFKPLERCLNWRRIDDVGDKCKAIMDDDLREKSMDLFCAKDRWLSDCRCINRRYYKEYQDLRPYMTIPDYCWYNACKSGAFLTKRKGERVSCVYEYCEPLYFLGFHYDDECTISVIGNPDDPSEPMYNPDY